MLASSIRAQSVAIRDASAAGPIARDQVLAYMVRLSSVIANWNAARSAPNIGPYAQNQLGNGTLDIDAEFTAMLNAATALRDWIFTNFPKDAGGAWLLYTYDSAGAQTSLTFTTAQLAQFRTNIDAFVATIS